LKITDRNEWKTFKKQNEKIKFSRKFEDIINPQGVVSVKPKSGSV